MTPLGERLGELAAQQPRLRAFLRTIIFCEHGEAWVYRQDVYRRRYGGMLAPQECTDPGGQKPREAITAGAWTSTACGAYQFLNGTWDECVAALGVDFSPAGQDAAATFLLGRRGALSDLLAGRIEAAVGRSNKEWASLPGSPYGQPTVSMPRLLAFYERALEAESTKADAQANAEIDAAPEAPVTQPVEGRSGMPIPAVALALLPVLAQHLPSLLKIIQREPAAPGVDKPSVTERNVQLAGKVAEIAMQATGSTTVEVAAERIATDPEARARADSMVAQSFAELMDLLKYDEASRGSAREFAARMTDVSDSPTARMWQAFGFGALISTVALIVLVGGGYMLHMALVSEWSTEELRGSIVQAVIAVIVLVVGYFFGSSASSRSKDQVISNRR